MESSQPDCVTAREPLKFNDWWVMGLRGTRSEAPYDDDAFVPERLSLDRETRRVPSE